MLFCHHLSLGGRLSVCLSAVRVVVRRCSKISCSCCPIAWPLFYQDILFLEGAHVAYLRYDICCSFILCYDDCALFALRLRSLLSYQPVWVREKEGHLHTGEPTLGGLHTLCPHPLIDDTFKRSI